jgi:hypothetical protein
VQVHDGIRDRIAVRSADGHAVELEHRNDPFHQPGAVGLCLGELTRAERQRFAVVADVEVLCAIATSNRLHQREH